MIKRHTAFVAVLVVLIFVTVVRLRVLDIPLERDEGEYAYSGQLILQHIPPYQLAYNMKFPGTYYAYAVIMAIFGQTASGIHFGLLLVNEATVVFLFFLALRLLGDPLGAAVAASAFAILSVDLWVMGIFAHATHFVVLAAVAGLLVLLRALESRRVVEFVSAGGLLGVSVLMKQNGIFFLALGLGIVGWRCIQEKRDGRAAWAFRCALLAVGSAIPFGVLCIVLLKQGVFGKFWFWTFDYAKEYASEVPFVDALGLLIQTLSGITQANRLIWLLAAGGVAMLWIAGWGREKRVLLTAYLIASAIAVCPDLYFRRHYFILLLPPVGLFTGVAVLSIDRLLSSFMPRTSARVIAAGVFVAVAGAYVINGWDYLFKTPTPQLSRMLYGANPFVEAPEVSDYIQARSSREERIAVFGSEPEIYFYARRKSATGYIYMYPLMEQQKYSQRMQEEMISEVTSAHPKYVVHVGAPTSWLKRNPDEKISSWIKEYLNECYVPAAVSFPTSKYPISIYRSRTDEPCSAR